MATTTTPMFTDVIARRQELGEPAIERDEAIKAIRSALKQRSGKAWSVRGGRGTAWGWIRIDVPPARRTALMEKTGERDERGFDRYALVDTGARQEFGYMTQAEHDELCDLLGLDKGRGGGAMHYQGVSIPAGTDYRIEYVARAEGRAPSDFGVPYWD